MSIVNQSELNQKYIVARATLSHHLHLAQSIIAKVYRHKTAIMANPSELFYQMAIIDDLLAQSIILLADLPEDIITTNG